MSGESVRPLGSPPARSSAEAVKPPLNGLSDLTPADVRAVLLATTRASRDDDVFSLAAGVAFKIFLSLFPSAVAAVALYGLVREPAEATVQINRLAESFPLPGAATEWFTSALQDLTDRQGLRGNVGVFVGGAAGALTTASGAAVTLIRALNRAYGIRDARPFLAQRGIALVITAALFAALGGLIALIVLGPQVQAWLVPEAFGGPVSDLLFTAGQVVAAVLLLAVLFAFVFWIGPNRRQPRWEWLSPGAVVGVIGWLVISAGFSLYTRTFGTYQVIYGALAGIIVLLLWLQLSMLVLLVGAELNAQLEHLRRRRTADRAAAPRPAGRTH